MGVSGLDMDDENSPYDRITVVAAKSDMEREMLWCLSSVLASYIARLTRAHTYVRAPAGGFLLSVSSRLIDNTAYCFGCFDNFFM